MQKMTKFNIDGRILFLTWFRKIQFGHVKYLIPTNFMISVVHLDAKEFTTIRI